MDYEMMVKEAYEEIMGLEKEAGDWTKEYKDLTPVQRNFLDHMNNGGDFPVRRHRLGNKMDRSSKVFVEQKLINGGKKFSQKSNDAVRRLSSTEAALEGLRGSRKIGDRIRVSKLNGAKRRIENELASYNQKATNIDALIRKLK